MPRAEPRLLRAQREATRLLEQLGIDDPSGVDLEDIAMHLGVEVIEGPLKGAEARLLRRGKRGRIRVRNDIREAGRRRFAVAHEIGHWCLHEASSQLETCMTGDIHGYTGGAEELESNSFAAELLIPKALILERYGHAERSIDLIERAAGELLTTFTATAVRLVETSNDPCLVVFSKGGVVQWSLRSRKAQDLWLERRQRVDQETTAWAAAQGSAQARQQKRVQPEAWFGHLDLCSRLEVFEQSILLGSYDTVVTIISCLEQDDDE